MPYFFCVGHDSVNNLIWVQINNVTRNTFSHSLGVAESVAPFCISGRDYGGSFPMTGWVDDFVLYMDRVVTQSEANQMYNSGNGLAITNYTAGPAIGSAAARQLFLTPKTIKSKRRL